MYYWMVFNLRAMFKSAQNEGNFLSERIKSKDVVSETQDHSCLKMHFKTLLRLKQFKI